MESRTITQIKLYVLVLNPMTSKFEDGTIVAVSTEYENIVNWYNSQIAPESYKDIVEGERLYHKTFEKNSELEWFNPADTLDVDAVDSFNHGIHTEWVEEQSIDIIKSKYRWID